MKSLTEFILENNDNKCPIIDTLSDVNIDWSKVINNREKDVVIGKISNDKINELHNYFFKNRSNKKQFGIDKIPLEENPIYYTLQDGDAIIGYDYFYNQIRIWCSNKEFNKNFDTHSNIVIKNNDNNIYYGLASPYFTKRDPNKRYWKYFKIPKDIYKDAFKL